MNWAARIIGHDSINNGLDPNASITAPSEVEARKLHVELILARRYRQRDQRLRIKDVIKRCRRGDPRLNSFIDTENEENKEERREELKKSRSLVPP